MADYCEEENTRRRKHENMKFMKYVSLVSNHTEHVTGINNNI